MNVVDSSGWLEYFADDSNADFFAPAVEKTDELVVPTVSIFEVFKRMRQQKGDEAALQAITAMMQGQVVELDAILALNSAKLSGDLQISIADSMILATAQAFDAELWTQDADLKDIDKVKYIKKK
ncbi:MAG: type II toxin-antitoxin system VapC family toxin [Anaerolineales bacterium]|jgi:predicted nucleic acid-binding protein